MHVVIYLYNIYRESVTKNPVNMTRDNTAHTKMEYYVAYSEWVVVDLEAIGGPKAKARVPCAECSDC